MKRADSSVRQRVMGPCLLVFVATMSIADSFAQTARFTIIDARDGLTPDVMDAYAEALGSKTSSPIVKSRVKVIASAKHGFDAGAVDVPDQVRNIETDVTILVRGGADLHAPLSANELTVHRRPPHRIKQTSNVQGH